MNDMIEALLDVVRAQHSATEGTDEAPFNMDDVVDMAINILGRPDDPEEEAAVIKEIEDTVTTLAPDIFPPKTFEQLDDTEQAASAVDMIQQSLLQSARNRSMQSLLENDTEDVDSSALIDAYQRADDEDEEEETEFSAKETADLNDLIYQNFMQMMGMNEPQVEFPFDRSQIRYGKEKSVTEMLAEEEQEKQEEKARPMSAWELAQNAIDADVAAHTKEEYVPKPMEMPKTKSASQLAAEAIAESREEDRMKSEIEKRAEALMEEARKQGKDPMAFALHQQEILQYMEKNSDELVSFEDYEDLSPEEKMEIERAMEAEKAAMEAEQASMEQEAEESAPEPVEENQSQEEDSQEATSAEEPSAVQDEPPVIDEEMLRRLSQEVLSANSDEILAENADADMESLNQEIMENIRKMMQTPQTEVTQESVDDLLDQVAARHSETSEITPEESVAEEALEEEPVQEQPSQEEVVESEPTKPAEEMPVQGISAADLARAAQTAAGVVQPTETVETKSAVEVALEAMEKEKNKKKASEETTHDLSEEDLNLDDFDFDFEDETEEKEEMSPEATESDTPVEEEISEEASSGEAETVQEDSEEVVEEVQEEETSEEVPEEYVLGMHTQAEVDEALENLKTLNLEGEVLERAKRLLLLELAGSEAELDAWLAEQAKKEEVQKEASALDQEEELEDLSELEGIDLEAELEEALEEEFDSEDHEEEPQIEEEIPVNEEPQTAEEPQIEEESQTAEEAEPQEEEQEEEAKEEKAKQNEYGVSVRTPFVLKNSATYIDRFKDYIVDTQENRKLSTGFKRLDAMLRYGLHKGSYFIDSQPQHLKNIFMQQIADRAAEGGVDVLYISTELSRFDLMVETISRLSYEINGKNPEKAVSAMAIMTGEEGADLSSLEDELNWYRGRISEHLFIFDQESVDEFLEGMEDASAGVVLEELIRSIVRDGAHKPVVFIDNIENILSVEESEDMKPLMDGIRELAKELGIPIILSYGYAPEEYDYELYPEEKDFRKSIGTMCDVHLELSYADTITEDHEELTPEKLREMSEEGDSLLVDIRLLRNRRTTRAGCQIQATPKFNYFEE